MILLLYGRKNVQNLCTILILNILRRKNEIYKKLLILVLLFIGMCIISSNNFNIFKTENKIYSKATISNDFADDSILVLLNEEASYDSKKYNENDFESYGCEDVKTLNETTTKRILKSSNKKLVNKQKYNRVLELKLNTNSKENVLDVMKKLMLRSDVLYAGPNYKIVATATTPNDTYLGQQWAINSIKLKNAWDTSTGSSSVLVGVMDTGLDATHFDLSSSIVNSLSRNFTDTSGSYTQDYNGHGTHVAGIIGARGNNNTGIAGANWNVGLVPLKILGDDGTGYMSYFANALDYAEDNNIKILNASFGFKDAPNISNAGMTALIASYSGLLICAAGNDSNNNDGSNPKYPASASASNIISVGSHKNNNAIAATSNYGQNSVDIYAPGESILSTFYEELCDREIVLNDGTKFCELDFNVRLQIEELVGDGEYTWETIDTLQIVGATFSELKISEHYSNGYHYMDGTSMAAPHVTGVAALLLSVNQNLTVAQLKAAILNNADTMTITVHDGTTQTVKKLNADEAIDSLHVHNYSSWTYFGRTSHIETCNCGNFGTLTGPHVISSSDIVNNRANCLECGQLLNLTTDIAIIFKNNISKKVSINGSYIFPSGTIVLVDEDIEKYFAGTLVFYNEDELPQTG